MLLVKYLSMANVGKAFRSTFVQVRVFVQRKQSLMLSSKKQAVVTNGIVVVHQTVFQFTSLTWGFCFVINSNGNTIALQASHLEKIFDENFAMSSPRSVALNS